MAGRPLRRERIARLNCGLRRNTSQNLPPVGYTWIGDDPDENYEIAMSEDGVGAYKVIGRVMEHDSSRAKEMWQMAGRQLTPAVMDKFVSLPDGFYPGSSLVGVGFDGNAYSVYLLDEEDVSMRRLAKNISTAAAAELLAQQALAAAQTPRAASNPHQRSR